MAAYEGSCLCGQVTFAVKRSYLSAFNCYCGMCRRAHGTPFSTHIPMRRDQFVLGSGQLEVFASSRHGRREYCPGCGSHVLVHGQTADGSVAVPAGLLHAAPVVITAHIFVAEKVPWWSIDDALPQHAGWPPGVSVAAP